MRFDEVKTQEQLDEFKKTNEFCSVVLMYKTDENYNCLEEWWEIDRVKAECVPELGEEYDVEEYDDGEGNYAESQEAYLFNNVQEAHDFYCDKEIEQREEKIAVLKEEQKLFENRRKKTDIVNILRSQKL
jgi:hypothetical protein